MQKECSLTFLTKTLTQTKFIRSLEKKNVSIYHSCRTICEQNKTLRFIEVGFFTIYTLLLWGRYKVLEIFLSLDLKRDAKKQSGQKLHCLSNLQIRTKGPNFKFQFQILCSTVTYGINPLFLHMSHVMRKPVFGVYDEVRLKLACSATEVRKRIEISAIASRGFILSRQRTTKALIRLRGCAGWSALCCSHMA